MITKKGSIYAKAESLRRGDRCMRKGQSLMNALHAIEPDLYNEITGSDADCFYNDGKMVEFEKMLDNYYKSS